MRNYRGYYIDNVIFNSKEDIDNFIKAEALRAYKSAVELFAIHSDMANSIYCNEKAEILVNQFGYTWEDIEAIEIETLEAIA